MARFVTYFLKNLEFNLAQFNKKHFSMSRICLAKEAVEKLRETNPYYEKYASKIAKLQQTSPEEFVQRIENIEKRAETKKANSRTYSELLNSKSQKSARDGDEIPYKKLSDIMKVDLIECKSAEEITNIWIEYHKTRDSLAATLSIKQFETLMENALKYPMFLLPLPRSEGFEFIVLQFASNSVHFTPLIAYQVHAENAPECLTVTHYTETKEKGIVLMRGEYNPKVLTGQEAKCLVNELQMFYCKPDNHKKQLLETFNKQPDQFKHMDLIKEVQNIQLI